MYFLTNNDFWTIALNEWEDLKHFFFSFKSFHYLHTQASKSVIFHFENYDMNGKYS